MTDSVFHPQQMGGTARSNNHLREIRINTDMTAPRRFSIPWLNVREASNQNIASLLICGLSHLNLSGPTSLLIGWSPER
jgi:hypothetical protein